MTANDERTPAQRVHDIPLILDALGRAVRDALLMHKRAGNPVAVKRDGEIVMVPPEEIPDLDEVSEPTGE